MCVRVEHFINRYILSKPFLFVRHELEDLGLRELGDCSTENWFSVERTLTTNNETKPKRH